MSTTHCASKKEIQKQKQLVNISTTLDKDFATSTCLGVSYGIRAADHKNHLQIFLSCIVIWNRIFLWFPFTTSVY